ncbi:MAG: zinc dependent phospholipase C family protein [Lachnospiraceae bacterium]|nr:zinc dependent phospholipase C family protein [Lachnospiraceae bacterium]
MRKKSHISLAGQMMNTLDVDGILKHRMTFYLGNILPDCRPSFLTTPHTFEDTFEKVGKKMEELVDSFDTARGMTMGRTLCMGELTHYIADYFTFPHNNHYDGSLKDHCCYEGDLKRRLKEYIDSGRAMALKKTIEIHHTVEELLSYVKESHRRYMAAKRCIKDDMDYIITVCTSVFVSLLSMCCRLSEELINRPAYVFVS